MKFLVAFLALVAVAHGYSPRLDGRIVGGQEVDISNFPYQASVRFNDQHICGGSILDANTILTAAHCVDGMDHSQYSVRVGNTRHASGTSHRVNKVIQNEEYNPNSVDHDMAILKLASDISLGSTAQAVALQPWDVAEGTTAWVSGWGVLSEGSQDVPDTLRAVDVAVVSNKKCTEVYGEGAVTSNMLCAQTVGHDSCQGDSGGPLVVNGKLLGVVSWGYGCARPQYPGIYASVPEMYSWIEFNRYL